MIRKGAWVRIRKTVLNPEERAENIPEETRKVPLFLWTKGYLLEDAEIGSGVKIKTPTGRIEAGTLLEENPAFRHDYGPFVPEILKIREIVREELAGDE